MLEKLPHTVGRALRERRPGLDAIVYAHLERTSHPAVLQLSSPAFPPGGALPARYTADGTGLSPPLVWSGAPSGTRAVALLIEDADSPTPHPLVHALAVIPGADGVLAEGALKGPHHVGDGLAMGRNSYLLSRYLPPDPPPAHGPHYYAFQIFALDFDPGPRGIAGRSELREILRTHELGRGMLLSVYERD